MDGHGSDDDSIRLGPPPQAIDSVPAENDAMQESRCVTNILLALPLFEGSMREI
jgi:hypothetical protein